MRVPPLFLVVFAGALLVVAPARGLRADEAVLSDGRRLSGGLRLEGGRLRFVVTGRAEPLGMDGIEHVRFPAGPPVVFRSGVVHRVALRDGQVITGELLGLDEKELRLRTYWADRLALPRAAVAAVTQPPGRATLLDEDFETEPKGWILTGTPALSAEHHTSGRHSLILARPGQAARYTLPTPFAAGLFAVNFREVEEAAGLRWLIEAVFESKTGPRLLRVVVAGKTSCEAEVPGETGVAGRLPRGPGWHRLRVEFAADALLITLDDVVLWHGSGRGPGGTLREVRLTCAEADGADRRRGSVAFDEFTLARAIEELPRPPADPSQDELWLLSGDQLFGKVPRADRRTLHLSGPLAPRTLSWAEVRGIYPRREPLPPRTTDGVHVRVWLRSGDGAALDEVEGVLRSLDEKRLVLAHPLVGEVSLERGQVHRLRWLLTGRRIER